jgi:hypothetical protein
VCSPAPLLEQPCTHGIYAYDVLPLPSTTTSGTGVPRASCLVSLVSCLASNGRRALSCGAQIEGVYNDSTKQESRIGKRVEIEVGPRVR